MKSGDKIFITGATGLIGSRLLDYLIEYNFSTLGCFKQQRKFYNTDYLVQLDLLDLEKLTNQIKNFQPNIIFHLASLNNNSNSIDPYEIIENNLRTTNNLLKA